MRRHREQGVDAARYRLRRNLHRLEKGLAMPEQKGVFAASYIDETVTVYEKLLAAQCGGSPDGDLVWAYGVLKEYFARVGSEPSIAAAAQRFAALAHSAGVTDGKEVVKTAYRDLGKSPIAYDDLINVLRHRKAVRWYLQEPVSRELLEKAVSAAAQAPSACNRQAFKFVILNDKDRIRSVTNLLIGVSGFDHQIPCLILVVGDLSAYDHARDRHLIYVDGGLAAMNFMLAADSLGLGCCPVNWPDIPASNNALAELLDLRSDQRAVMVMAVGYPDPEGSITLSQRRTVEQLIC